MRSKLQALMMTAAAAALLLPAAVTASGPDAPEVTVHRLGDLADGETRRFGEGERSIQATRHGDEVTLTLPASEEGAPRSLVCRLESDRCTVITVGGEHARNMVMVRKGDAAGDRHEVEVMALGAGGGEPGVVDLASGELAWHALGGDVLSLEGDGGKLLRCPEGDTTMHLGKDEASAGYRCPRHGVELVEVQGERRIRRVIRIEEGKAKDGGGQQP
jgi:hypothetical protein